MKIKNLFLALFAAMLAPTTASADDETVISTVTMSELKTGWNGDLATETKDNETGYFVYGGTTDGNQFSFELPTSGLTTGKQTCLKVKYHKDHIWRGANFYIGDTQFAYDEVLSDYGETGFYYKYYIIPANMVSGDKLKFTIKANVPDGSDYRYSPTFYAISLVQRASSYPQQDGYTLDQVTIGDLKDASVHKVTNVTYTNTTPNAAFCYNTNSFSYTLNTGGATTGVKLMVRLKTQYWRWMKVSIEDTELATLSSLNRDGNDYYNYFIDVPESLLTEKTQVTVKFTAGPDSDTGDGKNTSWSLDVYDIRLLQNYKAELAIGETGWATYYRDEAYKLADGLTAYSPTASGLGSELTFTDNIVPANYPLVIKGTPNSTYSMDVTNNTEAVTLGSLRGQLLAGDITAETAGQWYYYKLVKTEEGKVGFRWGKDDGGTFALTGNNRAYMVVEQTSGAKVQSFICLDNGELTGMDAIRTVDTTDGKMYNLNGQRIATARGLYIKNGKKYVAK